MKPLYDKIGVNYTDLRQPDRRIAQVINAALRDAQSVLNVGAGTGSYEPTDRDVIAVEPSNEMIRKRSPSAAGAIQARAEYLPFSDNQFDASMAILTIHHWSDKQAGLNEMRRVTRGPMVLLTFDPSHRPWLTDYLPELVAMDEAQMPTMGDFENWLGPVHIGPLLVPHDCTDGFLHAYWRRPEAYFDERIRSGSSSFWRIPDIESKLQRLRRDLNTGAWHRRHAALTTATSYDAGYRLIVATPTT
ncbi:MAG: methyltransferase domain-containing protein [Pseudomonadota bacterium]